MGRCKLRNRLYSLLQSCTKKKDLASARQVHLSVIQHHLDSVSALGGYLIRVITASNGTLLEANQAFCCVSKPCVFTWNAIIFAHAVFDEPFKALDLYSDMLQHGIQPNNSTYSWVLKTCCAVGNLVQGKILHQQAVEDGFETDVIVSNTLVDMYAKCGSLSEGRSVFDSIPDRTVVSWGALFAGYAQHGEGWISLALFKQMQCDGIEPNAFIYSCILKGCSNVELIEQGRLVHKIVIISKLDSDEVVLGTTIDMYAKCGMLEDAYKTFHTLPHKNVVLWGALITGFVDHGCFSAALNLFVEMQESGVVPSRATFLCALKACSDVGVVELGRLLHDHILRMGLHCELPIGSLLIEMYAKFGKLQDARRVFDQLPPNSAAWGTLIAAYAHVDDISCGQYIEIMQQEGLKPNDLTYSSLLSSFSHSGSFKEGCDSFNSMMENHGTSIEHYNCLVDLLGRSGRLEESKCLLHTMPFSPDFVGWTALLSNCNSHGNAKLTKYFLKDSVKL